VVPPGVEPGTVRL